MVRMNHKDNAILRYAVIYEKEEATGIWDMEDHKILTLDEICHRLNTCELKQNR